MLKKKRAKKTHTNTIEEKKNKPRISEFVRALARFADRRFTFNEEIWFSFDGNCVDGGEFLPHFLSNRLD